MEENILLLELFLIENTEEKNVIRISRKNNIEYIHNFEWDILKKDSFDLKIWTKENEIYIKNIKNIKDDEDCLTLKTNIGNIVLEIL